MIIYRATHDETGEIIEGDSKVIARQLKVVPTTINKIALKNGKVATHWKVQRIGKMNKADYPNGDRPVSIVDKAQHIPLALCEEWDKVTAPFKVARRKGARHGTSNR